MKNSYLAAILIVAIIVVIGAVFYFNKGKETVPVTLNNLVSTNIVAGCTDEAIQQLVQTRPGWPTYTSEDMGFSIANPEQALFNGTDRVTFSNFYPNQQLVYSVTHYDSTGLDLEKLANNIVGQENSEYILHREITDLNGREAVYVVYYYQPLPNLDVMPQYREYLILNKDNDGYLIEFFAGSEFDICQRQVVNMILPTFTLLDN